jgi:uncharacterized oxidoreductase
MTTIGAAVLRGLTRAIFIKAGSEEREADAVARRLVGANLVGHDSHGVVRVPKYVGLMRSGAIAVNAHAEVVFESDAMAVVDGKRGFGQVIGEEAMAIGLVKVRNSGVAVIALRHASHLGRIGDWAEQCAEAGYASLHLANVVGAGAIVAPFGGRERRLATNPFAAGMPVAGGPPIILDMATSVLAEGKVMVARNAGTRLPEGAIIDGGARPSTDPADLYGPPPGALLPFGAHKGFGLALFCDLLAGILSGGGTNHPDAAPPPGILNNMLSIILDPAAAMDEAAVKAEVEAFLAWVKSSQPLEPGGAVLVAGEPERRTRAARLSDGIPLDDTSWGELVATARELGIAQSEIDGMLRSET